MESVLELLHFIGIADHFDLPLVIWLEDSVSLNDLPNALFLFGEGSVLGWDFRLVLDGQFLCVILQNLHITVVKLLFVSFDERTS